MREYIARHKDILTETVWYTLANATVQVCSLFGILFVSRYLGPTNVGLFSFVQNFIAGFVTVLSGFDVYANWHIIRSTDMYREMTLYWYQKMVLAIPVLVLLLVIAFFMLPRDVFSLTVILCLPVLTNVCSPFITVTQFKKQARLVSLAITSSAFLLLLLKIYAVMSHAPLAIFVAINSLDGLILTIVAMWYVRRHMHTENIGRIFVTVESLIVLLTRSIYPFLYIVLWYIVVRADQFFVPAYFNAHTLGVYSSAVKVIEMSNVLIIILQSVIFPRILHISDPLGDVRHMYLTLWAYLAAGLVATLTIVLCAPLIVHILFGGAFVETVSILRVYAWSIPGLFVSYLFAMVFMARKQFRLLAVHALLFATVTLLLLRSVIAEGVLAVAFVSIVVYTASAIAYYLLWRRSIVV